MLVGNEARHMITVLRTETEQIVRLFDGNGQDGLFRVIQIAPKQVILEALELSHHQTSDLHVTLAIGWGKSKRRNYLFEKTVELRGNGIAFWDARRSQGHPPKKTKDAWREKCLQAAKQCGSPFVPTLSTLQNGIKGLIAYAADFDQCYLAWEATEVNESLKPSSFIRGKNLIVIGPEGGLEDEEAQKLIESDFKTVTLGDSILRWETAALYCLSIASLARQDSK
ncbi:RsmE family RNA methyltransferase [Pseudodesulfovibrio piezophilus]|uniref:Ribosomal RNA small subunit methyltransferase E n=1 Tax=Pseudodesulfovibrio piezophilus (strain DSM 21447 / JCM 15486 / C1TLV30) TaxID=1322246 RepID=M1WUX0_PSEP2|nr:RsmE family RNA methyltransferase [Pseudodesulfovibrio piezophilus]CCH47948.1 conserved protein of unknown function [Pseudodesulfovibrio piezophilus C1TLV30]